MQINIAGVTLAIGNTTICHDVHLQVPSGQIVGIIGPNGSGKSTLLRGIYRMLRPVAGLISIDNQDVWGLSAREAAQRTAVVAQEPRSDFDLRVLDVVTMGRAPYKSAFARDTPEDAQIVSDALTRVGMRHFAQRDYANLSGGEKQRVLIARALAQQAQVLVLDEPTNHLDIRYQLEILQIVRDLGVTTLLAVHDLNLAADFCDQVVVMQRGRAIAAGPSHTALDPALLSEVFGVQVEVGSIAHSGRRVFSYSLTLTPAPAPAPAPASTPDLYTDTLRTTTHHPTHADARPT